LHANPGAHVHDSITYAFMSTAVFIHAHIHRSVTDALSSIQINRVVFD